MKKKLMLVVLSIVMALSCVVGLTACGSKVDGTYYVYAAGEKQEGMSMTIDGDEVKTTMSVGGQTVTVKGTCKVDGKTVTVTAEVAGVSSSTKMTIVSDGVLKDENGTYYCKDGKTPPAEE